MASTRVVCMTFLIVSFFVLLHSDPIKGVGLSGMVFYDLKGSFFIGWKKHDEKKWG